MLIVLGVLGLFSPIAALADAPGTSAGDQQYIDPLAGAGAGHATSKHSTKAPARKPAAPTQAPAAPRPAPISPAPALAPPAPAPAEAPAPHVTYEASASTTPAPIAATSSSTASTSSDPTALPKTGYPGLLAVAIGLLLLSAGALLRRAERAW